MRFSPGCDCCPPTTCPADWQDGLPATLYATLTLDCAGFDEEVVELTYDACPSTASQRYYFGALPSQCGSSSLYQSVFGCDGTGADLIGLSISCAEGDVPGIHVALYCTDAGSPFCDRQGVLLPWTGVQSVSFSALDPVDFTLGVGAADTFTGACCEDEAAPTGTVRVTE